MSTPDENSLARAPGTDLRSGVAWNVASFGVLAVSGLAWNVVIGRVYGAAALGVFNQVYGAYVLFSMAASGGINYSLLRAVAAAAGDRGRIASAVVGALGPTVLLAGAASALFYATRHWIAGALDSPGVAVGMELAAPGLFFFALNKQLLAVVNGLRRMRAFAAFQALRYVLILGGIALIGVLHRPGDELSFTWTFSEGILFLLLALEVGIQVSWRHASELARWSREHFEYGIRSIASAMLLELNAKIDIWMLGLTLSDARVGVYSLAANLAEGFFQLVNVLQNNFNPLLANLLARGATAEIEALVAKSRRWIVPSFALAALAAALIYPWTLPLLAKGPEFQESWGSFAILVGSIGALAAWLPFGNLLLMAKHPAWNSLLMILVVGVNVAANALLIPRLGIAGAAAGTALAFGAFALLLVLFARKLVGVRL